MANSAKPPVGYDHTQAFQEAFGVRDAGWFLNKAGRELDRYYRAVDAEERVDALLNFANSVIALEDWALPANDEDGSSWRHDLRSESPAHSLIVLIALVAKHRRLRDGRFAGLRFERGKLGYWSEDSAPTTLLEQLPLAFPCARVQSVRTVIDDDEIVGYEVTIEVDGMMDNGTLVPLEHIMRDAVSFWKERLLP